MLWTSEVEAEDEDQLGGSQGTRGAEVDPGPRKPEARPGSLPLSPHSGEVLPSSQAAWLQPAADHLRGRAPVSAAAMGQAEPLLGLISPVGILRSGGRTLCCGAFGWSLAAQISTSTATSTVAPSYILASVHDHQKGVGTLSSVWTSEPLCYKGLGPASPCSQAATPGRSP